MRKRVSSLTKSQEAQFVAIAERVLNGGVAGGARVVVQTGSAEAHALYGPSHVGTLDRSQAPWVASDIATHAAQPDAHHAKQHSITDPAHHTVVGSIYSVVGLSGSNTLGVLATTDNGEAGNKILRTSASGGIRVSYVTTPLITSASGNIRVDPAGNTVEAGRPYAISIGQLTKKFLAIYAAELWIDTLVAQEVRATIGGRVMVAPTNQLIADLAPGASTIDVKYNDINNGDRLHMEGDGKLEYMAATSGPTSISGGYRYNVTRNLDLTGANQWYSGDAIVNEGQTGNGWIELYSTYGLTAANAVQRAGPTMVINVRKSNTYNDFEERFAAGNLNGLFGYSSDVYGAATGEPSKAWIATDATNGFRVMYNTTKRMDINTSGVMSFYKSGGTAAIRMDGLNGAYFASRILIDTSGEIAVADVSSGDAVNIKQSSGLTLQSDNTTDYSSFDDRRALTWRSSAGVLIAQQVAYDVGGTRTGKLIALSSSTGNASIEIQAIQSDKIYSPSAPGAPKIVLLSTPVTDYVRLYSQIVDIYSDTSTSYGIRIEENYIRMRDSGAIPGTLATTGALYIDGGALKYRGGSGTITILAPA